MLTLIAIVVVSLVVFKVTTPEERANASQRGLAFARIAWQYGREELEPFHAALRARTPTLVATPLIVGAMIAVFLLVPASASVSDGPRTTNGEWWRLATAMLAHAGLIGLIVDAVAIAQLGSIVERLVGRFAFATAFVASGLLAALTAVATYPLVAWQGPAAAIAGLYGFLAISLVAGLLNRSEISIPLTAVKRAAPVAVLFLLANAARLAAFPLSSVVGMAVGMATAIAVATNVSERKPETRRVAMALGASFIILLGLGVPLRGILDVAPELQRVVSLETQTVEIYGKAAAAYRKGKVEPTDLANTIDTTILPMLQEADARLAGLHHVPDEKARLVADARHFLELRERSWTLLAESLRQQARTEAQPRVVDTASRARAQAWHRSLATARGKAEAAEREALDALKRVDVER
jgi:rhomboid protease GluP